MGVTGLPVYNYRLTLLRGLTHHNYSPRNRLDNPSGRGVGPGCFFVLMDCFPASLGLSFSRSRSSKLIVVSLCFLLGLLRDQRKAQIVRVSHVHFLKPGLYTTWKVDGATPMYWFIIAPY